MSSVTHRNQASGDDNPVLGSDSGAASTEQQDEIANIDDDEEEDDEEVFMCFKLCAL
jgi:hypothetical protein